MDADFVRHLNKRPRDLLLRPGRKPPGAPARVVFDRTGPVWLGCAIADDTTHVLCVAERCDGAPPSLLLLCAARLGCEHPVMRARWWLAHAHARWLPALVTRVGAT